MAIHDRTNKKEIKEDYTLLLPTDSMLHESEKSFLNTENQYISLQEYCKIYFSVLGKGIDKVVNGAKFKESEPRIKKIIVNDIYKYIQTSSIEKHEKIEDTLAIAVDDFFAEALKNSREQDEKSSDKRGMTDYLLYQAKEMGAGVSLGILAFPNMLLHPINTGKGIIQTVRHPILALQTFATTAYRQPVRTVSRMLAGSLVMDITGGLIPTPSALSATGEVGAATVEISAGTTEVSAITAEVTAVTKEAAAATTEVATVTAEVAATTGEVATVTAEVTTVVPDVTAIPTTSSEVELFLKSRVGAWLQHFTGHHIIGKIPPNVQTILHHQKSIDIILHASSIVMDIVDIANGRRQTNDNKPETSPSSTVSTSTTTTMSTTSTPATISYILPSLEPEPLSSEDSSSLKEYPEKKEEIKAEPSDPPVTQEEKAATTTPPDSALAKTTGYLSLSLPAFSQTLSSFFYKKQPDKKLHDLITDPEISDTEYTKLVKKAKEEKTIDMEINEKTALHLAIEKEQFDKALLLINIGEADVNKKNKEGLTAFSLVEKIAQAKTVNKEILSAGLQAIRALLSPKNLLPTLSPS